MKLLGTLLAIGLLTPGVASAETNDVVVHEPDTTDVRDYWTPERIAAMPVGPVDSPGSAST